MDLDAGFTLSASPRPIFFLLFSVPIVVVPMISSLYLYSPFVPSSLLRHLQQEGAGEIQSVQSESRSLDPEP